MAIGYLLLYYWYLLVRIVFSSRISIYVAFLRPKI